MQSDLSNEKMPPKHSSVTTNKQFINCFSLNSHLWLHYFINWSTKVNSLVSKSLCYYFSRLNFKLGW